VLIEAHGGIRKVIVCIGIFGTFQARIFLDTPHCPA
jgi:hypothetical protein